MKQFLTIMKAIGKTTSNAMITLALTIVYLSVFPFYAIFIRFSRNIIEQHKVITKDELTKMF